jgi:ATP-dependent RNA helicase DeaD
MEKRPFTDFGLSAEVLKAVDKMGFEEASPIQTAAMPPALAGRDVIGQSSTGSGKTAAFAIPVIERIDPHVKGVQALMLCPTRELAVQVAEEVGKLALFKRGLHAVPIYGGQSYDRQFRALGAGVQIVIGTPGRIIDHIERGTLKLDKLRVAVLDEADRMLDMGFRDDIERILTEMPPERQTLFFSATMPQTIQYLIRQYTRDQAWIKIEALAQHAPKVDQVYFEVDRRSKLEVLTRLFDLYDFRYGIVFCSTKIMVDELSEHLQARGYSVDRLHGDISQMQRNRVMERFRERKFEFLIATDVAARGLDVDDLEVVFNFDLPNDAEDYTHRIGRTGRAGKSGRAFTFVSGREIYRLQSMIRFAKLKIRRENVPSLDQVEEARVNVFFEKLRGLLESGKFTRHERIVDRLMEQGFASTDIASALIHMLSGASDRGDGPSQREEAPPRAKAPASAPTPARERGSATPHEAPRSKAKVHEPVDDFQETHQPVKAHEANEPSPAAPRSERPPRERRQRSEDPDEEQPSRTGREAGFTTVFFSVGRKQMITPGDLVGKIAGVTRLPASVVGAIDIHQRHSFVDVASEHVEIVLGKLNGIRIKGESLKVAVRTEGE